MRSSLIQHAKYNTHFTHCIVLCVGTVLSRWKVVETSPNISFFVNYCFHHRAFRTLTTLTACKSASYYLFPYVEARWDLFVQSQVKKLTAFIFIMFNKQKSPCMMKFFAVHSEWLCTMKHKMLVNNIFESKMYILGPNQYLILGPMLILGRKRFWYRCFGWDFLQW